MMHLRSSLFFKTLLAIMAIAFLWSFLAQAQVTNTNATVTVTVPPNQATSIRAEVTPEAIWLTFGLNKIPVLTEYKVAGIQLWQYLASLIYVFLAFYVSKFLDYFIRERVRKWAEKTTTKMDDLLIELVRGPVKIVTFVILLHAGMKVYSWPEVLETFFSKGLKILVACSLTYVLLKAIDVFAGVWKQRNAAPENEQFNKQLLPLIRKTIKVFVIIVAALVTSQNLGLNVTGLIASLSIGGLAIGLAAQDTLANLFGAVAVLSDKPCRVGDRIRVENVDGVVEQIGFRSTRVRNLDGFLVSIPNKTMGNAIITNIAQRPTIKTELNIGLTYDTSAERMQSAVKILEEVFKGHPMIADLVISFNRFDSSSLNVMVVHWWKGTDMKEYLAGVQSLNLEVKRRFDQARLTFAFPTQTVYLKQDSDWRLSTTTT